MTPESPGPTGEFSPPPPQKKKQKNKSIYLNGFWQVSLPQETLGADESSRDPSRTISIANKVCDGAEVDAAFAADAVPAGNLRQVHQAGRQGHVCLL